ncbi:MAG: hypothetical protein V1679_01120 [Candidatus Peregrinibacteria bacterium]
MTTTLVGIKEFRQNLSSYAKAVKKGGIRLIVLRKNVPVLEVNPVDEKEFARKRLEAELKEAEEQVKRGEVYSEEEIMKEFGL